MLKIALFTDTYVPQINGVVAYVQDAIGELSKNHEVVLFAPGTGPLKLERVSEKFSIYWIPSTPFPIYEGYRISSLNYKRISDLLRKEKPDVVHAHAPVILGLQGMVSARRKKIPVVVTHHTHFPEYMPHLFSGRLLGFVNRISAYTVKKMIKHAYKMADVVIAPTEELARELRSYGIGNVVHLHNGIDFSKFECTPKCELEFRKKYGVPKTSTILYLGRVSIEKKLEVLLEAYRSIEREGRLLLIVGGGPSLAQMKKRAAALGIKQIIFTGFVDRGHLGAAYLCGDVFASPSDTETFGLTFVEAMHQGIPAIGVSRLGAKEVIADGETGILVGPGNARELAAALDRLLSNDKLRQSMGQKARARAEEFSIEDNIEKTLKIYRKLVTAAAGAGRQRGGGARPSKPG